MSVARKFTQEYAASAVVVCTTNGLANGEARGSEAISNTSPRYQDALVQLQVKLEAGTLGSEYRVLVYAYGSEDGTHFTSPSTGANETLVIPSPTSLQLIGIMEIRDNAGEPVFVSSPMSVAQAFGWVLPRKWGVVVANRTGRAFAGSGCVVNFSGVFQGLE